MYSLTLQANGEMAWNKKKLHFIQVQLSLRFLKLIKYIILQFIFLPCSSRYKTRGEQHPGHQLQPSQIQLR